jgi:hypothetical protein
VGSDLLLSPINVLYISLNTLDVDPSTPYFVDDDIDLKFLIFKRNETLRDSS